MRLRLASAALILSVVTIGARDARAQLVVQTGPSAREAGLATIGDGIVSRGVFNVNEYKTAGQPDPGKALDAALAYASSVTFLRGTYQFLGAWTSTRSRIRISADPDAVLVTAAQGAKGLLDLSGDDVTLESLPVRIGTAVADQVAIRMCGKNASVRHCRFEAVSAAGDAAHPQIVLLFDHAVRKSVLDNLWLPNRGVICLQSLDGNGLSFIGNEISNGLDGGFPEGWTPRSCQRGLDLVREEWSTITGNKFFGLGQPEVDKVEAILAYSGDETTEGGHMVFSANTVEGIAADRVVWLRACGWFSITGNIFGPSFGFSDALSDAVISVVAADGSTGGAHSGPGTIVGNDIHNSAYDDSDGCAIWLQGCEDVSVRANNFNFQRSKYVIRIDSDQCFLTTIVANQFMGRAGAGPSPISPIYATSEPCDGLVIAGNDMQGFTGSILSGSPTGVRVFTRGLYDVTTGKSPGPMSKIENITTNTDLK